MKRAALVVMVSVLFAGAPEARGATAQDPGWQRQWSISKVAPGALVGNPSVTVAVLDTGITAHPDLGWRLTDQGVGRGGGVVLPGYDFISDPWVAADGDGWDPDPSDRGDGVRSAEAADRSGCRARVSSWHGTNVAGTIGAIGGNGKGVTGIASGVRLLPVRILGRCGGNTADVAAGLLWAVGEPVTGVPINPNPAQVVNLSLSGSSSRCPNALQTAIDIANDRGASVVVASGSAATDTRSQTPANCRGVIVVGATDRQNRRAPSSNYGTEVTISAPGGNMAAGETNGIYTTVNTGRYRPRSAAYGYYQGSSAAAAHVAGVIANILARQPNLGPDEIYERITRPNALIPFAPGQCDVGDGLCGLGILSLEKVLTDSPPGQ